MPLAVPTEAQSNDDDNAELSDEQVVSQTEGAIAGQIPITWGRQPIQDLQGGSDLEWSTVVEACGRAKLVKSKPCLFCGFSYTGGPFNIRTHLEPTMKRNLRICKPTPAWEGRYKEVLAELRRRENKEMVEREAAEAKAKTKQEGRDAAAGSGAAVTFFQSVNAAAVTKAWMKVIVKKALPLDLVNDPIFRNAVELTAKAGSKNMLSGGELQLPKRKHMTDKILPLVDLELDAEVKAKVNGLLMLTGATLISDGWTSVANKPIINALVAVPAGSYFIAALDTSGETKDAHYIATFMKGHIERFGAEHIMAVCMDGACTASFPLIQEDYPHVFTYICPTHSLDNFMKNVCSDKDKICVKGIQGEFPWGESFLSDAIASVWDVVKFVSNHNHQKALARYRELAAEIPKESRPEGGTELIRYCETRFASKVMMLIRFRNVHDILEKLVIDTVYNQWVAKQARETRDNANNIKRHIRDEELLETVNLGITILEPVLRLLRMTDTKRGATLGKVYGYMLQLDAHYNTELDGLDEDVRKKLHTLFMARWEYFHVPIMTAAYRFEPEFMRRKFSKHELDEVKVVLKQMAAPEHTYPQLLCDLADFEDALATGSHDLNNAVAFSEKAKSMASYKWAKIYLTDFEHLQWAVMRIVALSCSASGCEDSWSVEAWIHSKKRNRLGQKTVERLVRAHTNLILKDIMQDWEATVLPWEIEMVPDEPEDEDEDGRI